MVSHNSYNFKKLITQQNSHNYAVRNSLGVVHVTVRPKLPKIFNFYASHPSPFPPYLCQRKKWGNQRLKQVAK